MGGSIPPLVTMTKKTIVKPSVCYDCLNARLMQHESDPVVAECRLTGERYVASAGGYCGKNFKQVPEGLHRKIERIVRDTDKI